MDKITQINTYCKQLKLAGLPETLDEVLKAAQKEKRSYTDFTLELLEKEVKYREEKDYDRRLKSANLPLNHNLDNYDNSFCNGLEKVQLNQLRELHWLEQNFNIILMGPSGTGKTYIASGLCNDAIKTGYKGLFRTIDQILTTLRLMETSRMAAIEYKRLEKADLIVIDDIMMFPIEKNESVKLFNLINQLFEKTSFIITTNKAPKEWVEMLNDEVLATALLDRLLYRCEVVKLNGESFRIKNRQTIFPS